MIEKDNIQDLLREKLQSHEVTPSDAVWKNVSSSLSSAAATSGAAAGASTLLKVAAAVVGVSGLSIATYFIFQEDESTINQNTLSLQLENNESAAKEIEAIDLNPEVKETTLDESSAQPVIQKTVEVESIAEISNPKEEIIEIEDIVLQSESNPAADIQVSNEVPSENSGVTENLIPAPSIIEPEPAVEETAEIQEEEIIESPLQEELLVEAEEEITLPNIFTPNNDGANDYFEIEISEKKDFQIVVIDQTNKVVFQSNSVDFRWDGTLPSGDPAPSGYYVYFISAKTLSGKDYAGSSKLRIQR
jgi:gliding motility-associated-like protein